MIKSWKELVTSEDPEIKWILNSYPVNISLSRGVLVFQVVVANITYACAGWEEYFSDLNFDTSIKLKEQCDFSGFHIFDTHAKKDLVKW